MKMKKKHGHLTREAFSLVEVIIAIAVLAVLMIPTLTYFTNASLFATQGKESQRAEVAGQSALEELKEYDTFAEIESLSSGGWTVEATSPPAGTAGAATLTKEIDEDGEHYKAYVTVDYDYGVTEEMDDFNNYEVPDVKQVYTTNSVVFAESDQRELAINELYGSLDSDDSTTRAEIQANATRELHLEIADVVGSTDLCTVRAYYIYRYGGKSTKVFIRSAQASKEKLRQIYLFYKPFRSDLLTENVYVYVKPGIYSDDEIKKLMVYFVLQNDSTVTKPDTYSFIWNESGDAVKLGKDNYFSNGIGSVPDKVTSELVLHNKKKRIAKISIDVYDLSDTSKSKLRAHVESAKGE